MPIIYDPPLLPGKLLKRYKRFLADVLLDTGEEITAHCPNSGAMLGIKEPGTRTWVQPIINPTGKLNYRFEMVRVDNVYIGGNTGRPNKLVEEALTHAKLIPFQDYTHVKREVKYGTNSRVDFLLTEPGLPDHYVEVKNVHHKVDDQARFPDSVTARGTKHLEELIACVKNGARASVIFIVQRNDCNSFAPATDIDPVFADTLILAQRNNVSMHAYNCEITPISLEISREIPIILQN